MGSFPSTRWTLVEWAGSDEPSVRRPALDQLLRRYLPAMKTHLVVGKRLPAEQAEDLLQGFVCSKMLERNLLGHVRRRGGKFRTFLLTALDRYWIDDVRIQAALRRTPRRATSLHESGAMGDSSEAATFIGEPSLEFDAAWARAVVAEAVWRMKTECNGSGRSDIWEIFCGRLLNPIWEGGVPTDHRKLAAALGLETPEQAANLLVTAKRMFRRTLQSVVSEYAVAPGEVEEELNALFSALHGAA